LLFQKKKVGKYANLRKQRVHKPVKKLFSSQLEKPVPVRKQKPKKITPKVNKIKLDDKPKTVAKPIVKPKKFKVHKVRKITIPKIPKIIIPKVNTPKIKKSKVGKTKKSGKAKKSGKGKKANKKSDKSKKSTKSNKKQSKMNLPTPKKLKKNIFQFQ